MSEEPNWPAPKPNQPSLTTIAVIFAIAAAMWLLGAYYDAAGRSVDEKLGSILPFMIGLLLFIVDIVLFVIWLVRRRKGAPPA